MNIKIKIPHNANKIINTLLKNGHEAYVVGGCVRDSLLGREPNDWDITTSALPHEVKKLFKKTIDTGLQHGTVTILMNKEPIEVTSYRIDGEYEDNRRPKTVEYTKNLVEDLKRRDFTINAMAYNDEDGLIDEFRGKDHLQEGIIKCVGNPIERFNEDALRMLRAIRFSAQLGFNMDTDTKAAIKELSDLIKNISEERIQVELNKTLISKNPSHIMYLYELGLMQHIIPEFIPCINNTQNHPYHVYDICEHILKSVEAVEPEVSLRWAMLLHDIGKPEKKSTDEQGITHFYGHEVISSELSRKILKRLKFDNKTIEKVYRLVLNHDYRFQVTQKNIRRAVRRIGDDLFLDYLKVQEADMKAQTPERLDKRLKKIQLIREEYCKIKELDHCIDIKNLAVNGRDLIVNGIQQGKIIGEILNKLLDIVIDYPDKNNKEYLLSIAIDFYNNKNIES